MPRYLIRLHDKMTYTYFVERIVDVNDPVLIPETLEKDEDFLENVNKTFHEERTFKEHWKDNIKEIIEIKEKHRTFIELSDEERRFKE